MEVVRSPATNNLSPWSLESRVAGPIRQKRMQPQKILRATARSGRRLSGSLAAEAAYLFMASQSIPTSIVMPFTTRSSPSHLRSPGTQFVQVPLRQTLSLPSGPLHTSSFVFVPDALPHHDGAAPAGRSNTSPRSVMGKTFSFSNLVA